MPKPMKLHDWWNPAGGWDSDRRRGLVDLEEPWLCNDGIQSDINIGGSYVCACADDRNIEACSGAPPLP